MITLEYGGVQNQGGMFVPNGSISFQLSTDARIIASPGGQIPADRIVTFQFDSDGNLVQPAQLYSNAELNPRKPTGLGTYYLVSCFDANGARINNTPMSWIFPNATGSTVNIGRMTALSVPD